MAHREESSKRKRKFGTQLNANTLLSPAEPAAARPPLKVAMLTFGSRGDMQPMFALANYLQRERNMELLVFTSENNAAFCEKLELNHVSCWPSLAFEDTEGDQHEDGVEKELAVLRRKITMAMRDGDAAPMMQSIGAFRALALPKAVPMILQALRAFGAELLVFDPLDSVIADAMSIVLGVPCVSAQLQLAALTSQTKSVLGETHCHYAAWLACFLLGHKTVFGSEAALVRRALAAELGASRVLLGECTFAQVLAEWAHPHHPILLGVSPHVHPKPSDLPPGFDARCHLTGFWVVDQRRQMSLSEGSRTNLFGGGGAMRRLVAFLDASDAPPVYLGWGSMVAGSAEGMARLAVRALRLANQRGIVLGGFAHLDASMLAGAPDADELLAYARDAVLFIESAPHEWLFPRCAALVHHGGSGTTAAGMRAGVPAVVTPIFADQYDNAAHVAHAHAGVALPQFSKVTPAMLAAALTTCVAPTMQAAAQALSAKLQSEDGLSTAADLIDRYVAEEAQTGACAAALETALAQRATRKRKAFLSAGGVLGGLHSAYCAGKALLTGRV